MATAIVVLLSLELAAALLLYGAQVISDYERIGQTGAEEAEPGFTTAAV
jgi:membrane protein